MNHETLYKRTKTGAIQYWMIDITEETDRSIIRKQSGQLGTTSPRDDYEIITKGKNIGKSNETTPLQQAKAQALSDWIRKHDEGYKSLEDLGISACTVGALIGSYMMTKTHGIYTYPLHYCLEAALPQFNTDSNGQKKPMLAKAVNWDKVTYPCLVQPKLDGVRCLMIIDNNNGKLVTFLSRSGKPYTTLDHIEKDVVVATNLPEGITILDGEIYSDEITFQEIIAAVKKQRPDSLKLKFRAYDIVNDNTQDKRIMQTEQLVHDIASDYVQMVGTEGVEAHQGQQRIMDLHNTWVSQGYEGAMIRLRDGVYDQGQRSSALLKVKESQEDEFKFMYWEYGQRPEDLIAVCSSPKGEFRAKMVGTAEQKRELEKHPQHTGMLTVKFFEYTDAGLPRFPIGKGFRLKEDS